MVAAMGCWDEGVGSCCLMGTISALQNERSSVARWWWWLHNKNTTELYTKNGYGSKFYVYFTRIKKILEDTSFRKNAKIWSLYWKIPSFLNS